MIFKVVLVLIIILHLVYRMYYADLEEVVIYFLHYVGPYFRRAQNWGLQMCGDLVLQIALILEWRRRFR
jgi:hypothetical protein